MPKQSAKIDEIVWGAGHGDGRTWARDCAGFLGGAL